MMDNVKHWLSFWFKCVTTDFLNFKGRTTRRDFWVFMLVTQVLGSITCGLCSIWALIPMFSIATRRLNDTGRSPYHHLLLLIPGCGAWVWYYLVGVENSIEGDNQHGPQPTSEC